MVWGYIGTSQPPAPQSVSGGQVQPGPCGSSLTMLRTAWSGGSYLPSLGCRWASLRLFPSSPHPIFPLATSMPFSRDILRLQVQTAPLERGSGDAGSEGQGEGRTASEAQGAERGAPPGIGLSPRFRR